jgi:hypothetical protein
MCCYIWMQHLSSKGVIILSSCHKYLGKYQYTEVGMANLEDEFTWKFCWYFKENCLCPEVCTMQLESAIICFLWIPNIYCCVYRSTLVNPVLSQLNGVYALTTKHFSQHFVLRHLQSVVILRDACTRTVKKVQFFYIEHVRSWISWKKIKILNRVIADIFKIRNAANLIRSVQFYFVSSCDALDFTAPSQDIGYGHLIWR